MKRLLAVVISILLLMPSFVYAEGGNGMPGFNYNNNQNKPTNYGFFDPNGDQGALDALSNSTNWLNDVTDKVKKKYSKPTMDYQTLYDAKLRAMISSLDKQRSSALSSLDSQQTALTNDYYGKRNQEGARSDIGALNFAQFMASKNVKGNAGAMPEIYRNNALQSNIGALNQQEAQGNAQIEADRTNVNNAYGSDLVAAKNQNQAELLQATINQQNADAAAALEQQRFDAQTKTAADTTAYNQLQDTKRDFSNNIGQFAADFLAQYNKVKNDGDPTNDYQLPGLMAAHEDKKAEAESKYQKQGYVSEDIAAALGLPVGSMTDAYGKEQTQVNETNAWKAFQQTGIANDETARILAKYGVTKGMTTTAYYNAHKGKSGGSADTPPSW